MSRLDARIKIEHGARSIMESDGSWREVERLNASNGHHQDSSGSGMQRLRFPKIPGTPKDEPETAFDDEGSQEVDRLDI